MTQRNDDSKNESASSGSCCKCSGNSEPQTSEPTDESTDGGEGLATSIFGTITGLLALVAVPKCPMCVTAYAGVLSAFGLGFLASAAVMEPLIGGLLVIQIGFVAWTTRSHRNPWPVVATVAGAVAVGLARWVFQIDPLLYVGAAAIIGAAAANFWLMQPRISKLRTAGS
ncbi:MAG: MerC family mercury resistance protein [Bradymonadaceae bacterium]